MLPTRSLTTTAAAGALLCLAVAPAQAEVVRFDPVSEEYAFETSECGYPFSVEGEFSIEGHLRVGKNADDSAFFEHSRSSFREVWTNTVTGAWFVVRGSALFQDTTATRVDGSTFEFTQLLAGQPFVVEDSDGRAVARDRGSIRYHVVFDTLGDDVPGGEFLDLVRVDVSGPHPGFDTDLCRYAADLAGIGSDSAQRYTLHPVGTTGSPLGYAEYLPEGYPDAGGGSPLLVFLHGSGESGDGSAQALSRLAWQAIPRYLANDGWPSDRPFVVLAPQHDDTGDPEVYGPCFDQPFGGSCASAVQHDLGHPSPGSVCFTPDEVEAFLDYALSAYDVDPSRVYLTGLSCGAFGLWEYLAEHSGDGQVAAAVPIAGEGRPAWDTAGCDLADVPVWAVHGALDEVVDPLGSTEPIDHLLDDCGASPDDASLTLYPDLDHDSWNRTYALGAPIDIYTWLLGKSTA